MVEDEILAAAKTKGVFSERKLTVLPLLKNCDNWKKVVPIGLIRHKTQIATYDGCLVELDGHAYFVRAETQAALKKEIAWGAIKTIRIE